MSEKRIAIIERCGQCCHSHYSQSEGWVCLQANRELPGERATCAPPEWCPQTPAAEVARVKPLVWQKQFSGMHYTKNSLWPGGCYTVYADGDQWQWAIHAVSKPCDSLEDGKARAEAHYRAALFGEHGPLERIA